MRSTKLTAITAAAAMLALAPTGASAAGHARVREHRRANAVGHCLLSASVGQSQLSEGESVEVFGRLACAGNTSAASQTVTIYGRAAGDSGGFQAVGTATTEAGGYYSFLVPSVSNDSIFYASAAGTRTRRRIVRVAPVVKLVGPNENTQLLTGRRSAVLFKGTVNRQDSGATVVLQRENATSNEEWHSIERPVLVSASGEFAITHRFVVPGDANIRVVVRTHGRFSVRGISNTLNYQISQKENPRLTLNASSDPISFGQTVTLSGTVAGAVNQPVTLLARGRGAGYAVVAQGTTNASGEYSFLQGPQQSTFYRVTSGSVGSAVLFEGVKYVLTANVSATTVQSGQPLTFSGTVTPALDGHPVYIEREDALGGGFHVVEVGQVHGSSYSIPDVIFGSGKETFRVKVPGDPANQTVSSSPFTIEVTPAPASA
ncbi:MAG: hypothetical protein ACYDHN_16130, partial [Solirubrobacteraceae bacterium]